MIIFLLFLSSSFSLGIASISARILDSILGWHDKRYKVHVRALAVVSCPAKNIVITSSLICLSVIFEISLVCSSSLSDNNCSLWSVILLSVESIRTESMSNSFWYFWKLLCSLNWVSLALDLPIFLFSLTGDFWRWRSILL